jgi:hypothetical protein
MSVKAGQAQVRACSAAPGASSTDAANGRCDDLHLPGDTVEDQGSNRACLPCAELTILHDPARSATGAHSGRHGWVSGWHARGQGVQIPSAPLPTPAGQPYAAFVVLPACPATGPWGARTARNAMAATRSAEHPPAWRAAVQLAGDRLGHGRGQRHRADAGDGHVEVGHRDEITTRMPTLRKRARSTSEPGCRCWSTCAPPTPRTARCA